MKITYFCPTFKKEQAVGAYQKTVEKNITYIELTFPMEVSFSKQLFSKVKNDFEFISDDNQHILVSFYSDTKLIAVGLEDKKQKHKFVLLPRKTLK